MDYRLFSSEITQIIRYSEVCMNNTVENDFFGFPKVQWLHLTDEVDNV